MSALFLDTETTGLHRDRRAWEISMIRRTVDGQNRITLFVAVDDIDLAHAESTALDIGRFHERHPAFGATLGAAEYLVTESAAVELIDEWTAGTEIFGIRPRFDTETLAGAFSRHNRTPRWWRDPVDITDLARGWVLARGEIPLRNPEALSGQCEVAVPSEELRHTAYGDADWVLRWFDALHAPALASSAACGVT